MGTHNHCVSRRNHCVGQSLCKNLLENNYQSPMFSSPPPSTYTTTDIHIHCVSIQIYSALINSNHCRCPLCVHTQSLCTLLENNFQGPMFIRGSPYKTTHITTVWAHTTTVYPTGKQLSGPRVYQGRPPPPPHNTNNHCVSRRNHCVGQFLCKNLLENNFQGPHVYKGFPL